MRRTLPAGAHVVGRPDLGFTYLGVLLFILISGIALGAVGTFWHTQAQREKEQELLFVGREMQNAIGRYHLNTPGAVKQYPKALEDLVKDPRYPHARRYLRKIYRDPITGTTQWGLIRAPDGGIFGIHSLSQQRPLKIAKFGAAYPEFEHAGSYRDWSFVHRPTSGTGLAEIMKQQNRPGGDPRAVSVPAQPEPSPALPEAQTSP